jgi:MFS family permease
VVASTFGEMVWVPTSQALTTELAPPGRTGAYLGAYSGAVSVAFAVGPLLALEIRGTAGDGWMWIAFAGLAVCGGALGVAALAGNIMRPMARARPTEAR